MHEINSFFELIFLMVAAAMGIAVGSALLFLLTYPVAGLRRFIAWRSPWLKPAEVETVAYNLIFWLLCAGAAIVAAGTAVGFWIYSA
jgi:hypothetical protein